MHMSFDCFNKYCLKIIDDDIIAFKKIIDVKPFDDDLVDKRDVDYLVRHLP